MLISGAAVTLVAGIALGILVAMCFPTTTASTRDLATSVTLSAVTTGDFSSSATTSSRSGLGREVINRGLMAVGTQRLRPVEFPVGLQVINPGLMPVGTQRLRPGEFPIEIQRIRP